MRRTRDREQTGAVERPERTSGPRRAARTTIAAFAAVAVVAFVLTAASAAATPIAAVSTHKAPYSGEANQIAFWANQGCGTTFSLKKLPELNLTMGTFVGSESASAKTCGSTNGSMFGEIEGSYGAPQFTISAGTYVVATDWLIKDTIDLAAASGAGGITAGSYAVVGAYALLEDVTNGTTWEFGNASAYYGNSTSATSHSYSYALDFSRTFKLVAGQHYELVTGIYAEVNTFVDGTKSSASASVNLGTSGKKATLSSVAYP